MFWFGGKQKRAQSNTPSYNSKAADESGARGLQSAIYKGWVEHRRFSPTTHKFRYQVFMMYLDLSELDEVFKGSRCWSVGKSNLAWFKREDYLGDARDPLDLAVRKKVQEETGYYPTGPVRMLTNLRYFGFIFNPITCYYIFNSSEQLEYVVAEVTNTPWKERVAYVLPCDPLRKRQRIYFEKEMHVSPFNPMNIRYEWANNSPAEKLVVHMRNWCEAQKNFDATLSLTRKEISPLSLAKTLAAHPFMTFKVVATIYWQALKLWLKRTPTYSHPKHIQLEKQKTG